MSKTDGVQAKNTLDLAPPKETIIILHAEMKRKEERRSFAFKRSCFSKLQSHKYILFRFRFLNGGREMKRSATLVGCNYAGTRNELRGCINDVVAMRDLLVRRFQFKPDGIVLLTDGGGDCGSPATEKDRLMKLPTGSNIKNALRRMISAAEEGDVLFFHYSGHGTLIPHRRRGEKPHEAIVPCDFNLITDVDLRELVDHLPAGAIFTIVSDCCHSGGLILNEKEQVGPNTSSATSHDNNNNNNNNNKNIPFEWVHGHLASLSGLDPSLHVSHHLGHLFGDDTTSKFYGDGRTEKGCDSADVDEGILLSGCQTDETSADVGAGMSETGRACGAFSAAVQEALEAHVSTAAMSNKELVVHVRRLLKERGFHQHPCLYCSDRNAAAPFLSQT